MRRLSFRHLLLSFASVTFLLAPGPATAGSLGDFSDSYNETSSDNEETEEDDDPDNDHTNLAEGVVGILGALADADSCDEPDCRDNSGSSTSGSDPDATASILYLLIGQNPGRAFSLGRGPYAGRGWRTPAKLDRLAGRAVANRAPGGPLPERRLDGTVTDDHFQWTLRTNALMTTELDAMGGEVFGKLTSSKMPGFAFSYQYAHELTSRDQLGLSYLTYEPNLTLHRGLQTHWGVGLSMLHGTNLEEVGLAIGLGFEAFPLDPMLFSGRAQLHGFEYATVGDLRGSIGVFLSDHVALEGNVRHLHIFTGEGLTSFGLGVRTYFGF